METSKTKKCTICKITKDIGLFRKRKDRKLTHKSECRECENRIKKEYRRAKDGLISRIYENQVSHSKKRNHPKPSYTKQELKEWLFSQSLFHKLYDNWKRLDYQKEYIPSVDRKDNHIGYTMDNIQLMTWAENNDKGYRDKRESNITIASKPQKIVMQFDKDMNLIKEFVSVSEASRYTNVAQQNISKVCIGERKTASGFKWAFKNE